MLSDISRGVLISLIAGTLFFLIAPIILPGHMISGWLAGFILGFAAIGLHYMVAVLFKNLSDNIFFGFYFLSVGLRFLIVLAIFVLILVNAKFDQISFTVSFIISYIFYSVNEIILINKKLTNHTG